MCPVLSGAVFSPEAEGVNPWRVGRESGGCEQSRKLGVWSVVLGEREQVVGS